MTEETQGWRVPAQWLERAAAELLASSTCRPYTTRAWNVALDSGLAACVTDGRCVRDDVWAELQALAVDVDGEHERTLGEIKAALLICAIVQSAGGYIISERLLPLFPSGGSVWLAGLCDELLRRDCEMDRLEDSFPGVVDAAKVGSYPQLCGAGGGYFYDDVLEYRVWVHPHRYGQSGSDWFRVFATYREAARFARETRGAEVEPLVLVRQGEWIDETSKGVFERRTGERLAEWLPRWLAGCKREAGSIETFLAERGA